MSTTEKLKGALGVTRTQSTPATQTKVPAGAIGVVLSNDFQKQLAMALPRTMTADRFTRIVATEWKKNPDLRKCNPVTVLSSVLLSAQLGLEPGSALGQSYLLPCKNKTGMECQLIIGYRGMLSLARRSGEIISINAYAVHQEDDFHYELGLHPDIHHVPNQEKAEPGPLTHVYAVAALKDGGLQFEVMTRAEVEKVRRFSKGSSSAYSPWNTHFEEMAKKTVIRRLFKYLPVSAEALWATSVDEKAERGETVTAQEVINMGYIETGTEMHAPEQIEMEETDTTVVDPVSDKQTEQAPSGTTSAGESGRLNWDDVEPAKL